MSDREALIEKILQTFRGNEFPGEAYLQGSYEGCEPYEEVGPFQERREWEAIPADFLDGHYTALSFFSEAGFRYFLPAYLIADLNDLLQTADPLFHLVHGFYDFSVKIPKKQRVFEIKSGRTAFTNPRRYGAMTSYDYARYRLSIFTREEARVIVAYLEYKRDSDLDGFQKPSIQAALDLFWLERARSAPEEESLVRHLAEQEEYLAAIRAEAEGEA